MSRIKSFVLKICNKNIHFLRNIKLNFHSKFIFHVKYIHDEII